MNRRSIIGPLILIAIGGMFLINNIVPDFDAFRLFSRYWPILLILWGVLRLVEILTMAARSQPLPPRGLSGGEGFLIFLICMVGLAAATVRAHMPNFKINTKSVEIFGETFDYPLSATQVVPAKARIVVDNLRGNVRVTGGDGSQITVTGRKTVRAFDKANADKVDQQTTLDVSVQGDRVLIRTNQERAAESQHVEADLELMVPRDATIEGRGRYGDYEVTDINGSVEITSDNAGVRLNRIGGNAKIELNRSDIVQANGVKGNVEVSGERAGDISMDSVEGDVAIRGNFSGNLEFRNLVKPIRFESRNSDMRVERIAGHLRMDLGDLSGENLVGPIKFHTKSRDIRLEDFTGPVDIEMDRGDVDLKPVKVPLSKIDVICRNSGNLELTIPEKARFGIAASTERGEIENRFGERLSVNQKGRSATLRADDPGAPEIKLTTNRGNITISK